MCNDQALSLSCGNQNPVVRSRSRSCPGPAPYRGKAITSLVPSGTEVLPVKSHKG
ncbi:hypothetical protein BJX64DRAFT_260246 [Aspergillus heterothallicus]